MRPSIAHLLVLPLALAACTRAHELSPIEGASPDGAAQPEPGPLVDTAAIVDLDKLTACVAAGKKAVRVDFEYDGKTLRVSSCSAVDMVVPGTVVPWIRPDQTGTWYEVRGSLREVLYQRLLPSSLLAPAAHEVPPPPGGADWHRVPEPAGSPRSFTVLFPRKVGALTLDIRDAPRTGAPSVLVARIPVRSPPASP